MRKGGSHDRLSETNLLLDFPVNILEINGMAIES